VLCGSIGHMTYCLGISLDEGLVFASDSRTHAGVDQISIYRKMHTFVWEDDRIFVLLSAGNLATTQAVIRRLQRAIDQTDTKISLKTVQHACEAAAHVGRINKETQNYHHGMQQQGSINVEASFIFGGQIAGEPLELFLIYPQGNFISVSPENPFLQIGETKYGKPILDRMVHPDLPLEDAARCALVSLDSTMRSNLSVGPPIDLVVYERDSLRINCEMRLEQDDDYLAALRTEWNDGLRRVFDDLPRLDWDARC
jgi:putative proteasome-type protease